MTIRKIDTKRTTKQTWIKLEITKIKLKPEQAVLSCCNMFVRAQENDILPFGVVQCAYRCATGISTQDSGS
ncbi:MAG: hypothetical protein PHP69_07465 [Candidatus Omnitrophica bacterium]|nr:hypothetical protein [Candidatus Omnitrophota bacterium]MDD5081338.1 hypothetical protein [Candidatus Omnitrophota bacterium]